jgi:hypothetical protein
MMRRLFPYIVCAGLSALLSVRADIMVNWHAEPIVLFHGDFASVQTPLDLNGDGMVDFTFLASISFVGVRAENSGSLLVREPPPPDLPGPAVPLSSGFEIGPDSEIDDLIWFEGHSQGPGSPGYENDFRNLILCLSGTCVGDFKGHNAFLGVEFYIDESVHYGWVNTQVEPDFPFGRIYGWGYETDPGVSIIAGAVPEPSTLVLLAAGSIALLYSRARKRIR